jgi:hypothetical protein
LRVSAAFRSAMARAHYTPHTCRKGRTPDGVAYYEVLVAKKRAASIEGTGDAREAPVPAPAPTGDVALVFGRDQHGTHILRRRSEESPIEAGLLRPLREGKPIDGEVVTLAARSDMPMLFDVKSELPDPHADVRSTIEGPAQVANDAYRKGWDAVWGRRRRTESLN